MKSPSRVFARILLGIYNILSTYLLGWVLVLSTLALGLHFLTEFIVGHFDFDRADQFWEFAAWRLGVDSMLLRFAVYGGIQGSILYFGRGLWGGLQSRAEAAFDVVATRVRRVTATRPRLDLLIRGVFTVAVTVVLVPFVVQPTMVGGGLSGSHWMERTANLADGTASRNVIDSVVGAYRQFIVDDVASHGGVDAGDVTTSLTDEPGVPRRPNITHDVDAPDQPRPVDSPPAPVGNEPMMDRWDPTIVEITGGDPQLFAFVKAFMLVESSGRQFAVSHTGCSGLMQFCAGTARRQPFRSIFGAGSVYTCGCHPNCSTPRPVIQALETGDRRSIPDLESQFPCDLTDARFDGRKSIRAGTRYIKDLANSYDGNLYLMYIGYNSGPGVANTIWRSIGRRGDATLQEIGPHLAPALRPHFHGASDRRARSLVNTHLPRLRGSYNRYRAQADDAVTRYAMVDEQEEPLLWTPVAAAAIPLFTPSTAQ